MDATNRTDSADVHGRQLEERLRDPAFRAKYGRVYAEMFEHLAPATEGPVANSRKRYGRLIFGDATE